VDILKCIIGLLWLVHGHLLLAQSDLPWSYRDHLPSVSHFQEMPALVLPNDAGSHYSGNSENRGYRFAHPFAVNLTPANSGEWTSVGSGLVWRLGIVSPGAHAIYATCQWLNEVGNARIFLYGHHYGHLSGPYQLTGLPSSFSLPAVAGDTLIIEINFDCSSYCVDGFIITKVWHDYVNVLGHRTKNLQKSAYNACDENIQCGNGRYWQTDKRAVCKIVSDGQLSTGTLIGNTAGSDAPLVLTSRHTMFSDEHAAQALFYFNEETQDCNTGQTAEPQVMMGSSLVAGAADGYDYALLRLHDVPPRTFRPYYAGWSRSSVTPDGGVCIHHPWGNAKQVAIDYHQPGVGSFNSNYLDDAFWHVHHWEVGTTSHGSSGAPLFDTNHRLIGTLTGGRASCSRPVDDYFFRFDLAWDALTSNGGSLSDWLDAKKTNAWSINGYDPYGTDAELCQPTWNVHPDYSQMKFAHIMLDGSAPQMLAEKFFLKGSIRLASVFLPVGLVESADPLAQLELRIWQGDGMPQNEVYSQPVFLRQLSANEVCEVRLDSLVVLNGDFFVGVQANASVGSSRLSMGYLPGSGLASSTMMVFNGNWHGSNSGYSSFGNASLCMGVRACDGKVSRVPPIVLSVYPNPCRDHVKLLIPDGVVVESLDCYDLLGRKVEVDVRWGEEGVAVSFNLPHGNYVLKIGSKNSVMYSKFTVAKY
jgi:lysyl endopeptidase